jgi:hypothetical protein
VKDSPWRKERRDLAFEERQMIRRMFLAISFVATLGVAGFVSTGSAEAHGCGRGGYGGYGGYYGANYNGGYGYYPNVYRTSYYPPTYLGPPVYGGYGGHHHHHHNGAFISIGF